MKKLKFIIVATIMVLCLSLAACDPADFFFDYDELKEQVVAVELISYDYSNVKMVKDESEVLPFDFDKMEIIEILEAEQIDDFLQDLSEIHFLMHTKYSESAIGISIRIIYKNGDFVVVSSNLIDKTAYRFVVVFNADGKIKEIIGGFASRYDYVDLVNKFFDMQIT